MPKHHIVLTENDIAKIINGEEIHIEFKQPIKVGEKIIVRQSYMKDIAADTLIRKMEDELQELKKKLLTLTKENNQVNDELIDEFRKNKRYWEFINNIKTASEQPISYDELLGVIQSEYKALEESE